MDKYSASAQIVSALIENSSDLIFVKDLEGRYISVNPAAVRCIGSHPDRFVGKTDFDFFPKSVAIEIRRHERDVIEAAQARISVEKLSVNGVLKTFRTTRGLINGLFGEPDVLYAIMRDVTDEIQVYQSQIARIEAEASMRRSLFLTEIASELASPIDLSSSLKKLSRIAVGHLADWCAISVSLTAKNRGVESSLNQHAAAHRDQACEEVLNLMIETDPAFFASLHPASRSMVLLQPVFISEVSDVEKKEFAHDPKYLEYLEKVGSSSLIAVPICIKSRAIGFVLIGSVVPHRYGMGDLTLTEMLAERVALAAENAMLYTEARQAVRVRDEFLSIASHELKTPLTPLKMQVQLLKRLAEKQLLANLPTEQIMSLLDMADREINRLSKLVSNLLSVSRIAHGTFELNVESVHVLRMIDDVVARFKPEISSCGSSIDIINELQNPIAQWDGMQMEQLFTNLLTNAIKYGRGLPIKISVADRTDVIHISIQDQGIGIEESEQSKIFERFERTAAARRFHGLGLGLYICRQIVESHRGRVSVESVLNQGSVFTVEVPRAPVKALG